MTYANAVNNGASKTIAKLSDLSQAQKNSGASLVKHALKMVSDPLSNALNECKLNRSWASLSSTELGGFDSSMSGIVKNMEHEFAGLSDSLRAKAQSGDSISSIMHFFQSKILDFKRNCAKSAIQLNELTDELKEHRAFTSLTTKRQNHNEAKYKNALTGQTFGTTTSRIRPRGLLFNRQVEKS